MTRINLPPIRNAVPRIRLLACVLLILLAGAGSACAQLGDAEARLYNGITLPAQWPPQYQDNARDPMPVPYLQAPPEVIRVDVGRQLFVDDFLIEETDLSRTFHRPQYHEANPVLTFDRPWESAGRWRIAAPFSDGVWWDHQRQRFVMWYLSGDLDLTCFAESADGIHWTKPDLDIEPGTNIVMRGRRDSSTIWLDVNEPDAQRRFKMIRWLPTRTLELRHSPDGIHWSDVQAQGPWAGDRTTFHYNPFRSVWVASLRMRHAPRRRAYHEHEDLPQLLASVHDQHVPWLGADRLDRKHPQYPDQVTQMYAHDAIAYESLMLGFFSIYMGPENRVCASLGIQKHNEVQIGFSRDGFHWDRPDREAFLGVDQTDGAWNWGNVQSVGGGSLVVGDKLYFYVSGRALNDEFWDSHVSTGLAILRRDGFASMNTQGRGGSLTTRPIRFDDGRYLFVNIDAPEGTLRVEILDESGQPIEPFTFENCDVVTADSTRAQITWGEHADLSVLQRTPVRLRFETTNGELYAFWVSPDESGTSQGYVAAGGPGYAGPKDE